MLRRSNEGSKVRILRCRVVNLPHLVVVVTDECVDDLPAMPNIRNGELACLARESDEETGNRAVSKKCLRLATP